MKTLNDKELKAFTFYYIYKKEKESIGKDFIEYPYYELRVKYGLNEKEIDVVLRISRDYFENKNYDVFFTNAEFQYKGQKRKVETNNYLMVLKNIK